MKFVTLWNWTEKGLASLQQSPDRAEAYIAAARKLGVKVETVLWTAGGYDGISIIDAPDAETASALALSTAKLGNITTCTLRAYDTAEFRKIVAKLAQPRASSGRVGGVARRALPVPRSA